MSETTVFTCKVCGTRNRDSAGTGKAGLAVMTCASCGHVIEPRPSLDKFGARMSTCAARFGMVLTLGALAVIAIQAVSKHSPRSELVIPPSTGLTAKPEGTSRTDATPARALGKPSTPSPFDPDSAVPDEAYVPIKTSTPSPPSQHATTPAAPVLQPVAFPNGSKVGHHTEPMAPFKLTTPNDGQLYYAKLVDTRSGNTAVRIYMGGGQTREFEVPLGTYELRYASGETWYGEKHLFGPATQRFKAETRMSFSVNGNRISGHRVELIKQAGGNLETSRVNAENF